MLPSPYWDRNDNGLYDSGDLLLPDLAGAVDPRGAVQTFPIRNTPPSVAFASNPLDPTSILRQPDTTYTVATFAWNGSDPDGNNTLQSYRIALNDTTQWLTVSLRDTIVTLVVPRSRSDAAPDVRGTPVTVDVWSGSFLGRRFIGQLPKMFLDAPNVFWVEAKDVAGEYSPPMQMPSGPDHWYVRRPRGSVLLVSDYITFDAPLAQGTYLSAINSILGLPPSQVSRLNIGLGLSANDKSVGKAGTLVPSFIDPALIQTFLLFDYVFWYTDFFPSLSVAQLSLFDYIQNGGKVLFSTAFLNTLDPRNALRDFAPIDSVSSVQLSPIIPANYVVYADSSNPANIYPQLAFNASPANHSIYMRPVYRRSDGRYLYHLQADTSVPPRYNGAPNIAVVDGQGAIVFVGVPVHLLNNMQGGLGVTAFLSKVFLQEFNPNHRINRRVF
jgi:hypothetical protein